MRSPSILRPGRAGWAASLIVALLPAMTGAAPASIADDQAPAGATPPVDVTVTEQPPPAEATPPVDVTVTEDPPPAGATPVDVTVTEQPPPADEALPVDVAPVGEAPAGAALAVGAAADDERGYMGPDAVTSADDAEPTRPKTKKKKKKKKKKPAKKKKQPKEPHKVNRGADYRLGLYPGSYVQGQDISVGAQASARQTLDPKPNHRIVLGLGYEYEPFSTKTLGFPEEDDVQGGLNRTLVQSMHIIEANAARRLVWGKLVTTFIDLHADAWWPMKDQHQRWAVRLTSGIHIGKATGLFAELENQLFFKKFPNYFIATRRIDQEGSIPSARIGYNFGKLARLAAGFTFDYTHYLDARYNALAPDGTFIRAEQSKNYLDYIPFAELQLRPTRGLRIRGRYAFERQKTQHYNRVMTGRDEFASLTPYLFRGYYDYRRHRASLGITWDLRDRLRLAATVEAWVRHFDVYEARDVDNFWTGQLRLDTEIEASLEAAVRVHTIKGRRGEHDFFISLLGAHVSRNSNMTREISLATNFDITRVLLGFEVRGHQLKVSRPPRSTRSVASGR